ncbi:MAG: PorV/PorQ family protein [Elusimicrobia bacterium]|nr:PorV/PorQ family protein [Elusimicrobiota bacterium]
MKNAGIVFFIIFSLAPARPCAAGSAGAEPFDFLFLDANSRPAALGGAYTALAADSNALLYNPAGLAKVNRSEATFMHNVYIQQITQDYIAYAGPKGWSANLNFLGFGNVRETTLSDPEGAGLGETTLTDLAFGAGYGRALTEALSAGAGVKCIRETIDGVIATGFALDAGLLYAAHAFSGLTLGLAAQNFGPAVRFVNMREDLPFNLRAGAAYEFKIIGRENVIALDVMKQRSQTASVAVGAETRLLGPLALRFGFNTRNDVGSGFTAGFAYLLRNWSIDYAFVPMGDIGGAHRFSVTLRWQ